jgi:vacuolar-type H+-ATPase subunit E/Vma4
MPESNQKLDRFTATIMKEAMEESDQAMAEYQKRRQNALSAMKKQAGTEARAYLHAEITRMRTESGREVAQRMQATKRALFQRRNAIASEVFAQVRQKIAAYTATSQYVRRMQELMRQALDVLEGADRVTVYLRREDRSLISGLKDVAPEVHMTFLDGSFQLGGLIVESAEIGQRVDSSFDSRLEELSGHFAELFGISLSDAE